MMCRVVNEACDISENIVWNKLSLITANRLPVDSLASDHYQSLHFERGHCLLPDQPAAVCLNLGLYLPASAPKSAGWTRIARIQDLLKNERDRTLSRSRLKAYAQTHGTGWDWEEPSGFRVSCAAVLLDAISPNPELTKYLDKPRARWYEASKRGNEFATLEDEYDFFDRHGVKLDAVEHWFQLKPGELLVIDNCRYAHAGVGARRQRELVQFIHGIESASVQVLGHICDGLFEATQVKTRTKAAYD